MSGSNSCFLACIQVSGGRSGGLYSHLFKNFPQFVVIHTVKGFSIVNEAEVFFILYVVLYSRSIFIFYVVLYSRSIFILYVVLYGRSIFIIYIVLEDSSI